MPKAAGKIEPKGDFLWENFNTEGGSYFVLGCCSALDGADIFHVGPGKGRIGPAQQRYYQDAAGTGAGDFS